MMEKRPNIYPLDQSVIDEYKENKCKKSLTKPLDQSGSYSSDSDVCKTNNKIKKPRRKVVDSSSDSEGEKNLKVLKKPSNAAKKKIEKIASTNEIKAQEKIFKMRMKQFVQDDNLQLNLEDNEENLVQANTVQIDRDSSKEK